MLLVLGCCGNRFKSVEEEFIVYPLTKKGEAGGNYSGGKPNVETWKSIMCNRLLGSILLRRCWRRTNECS